MAPIPNLEAYPKQIMLLDGTVVSVRPLEPKDQAALLHFFHRVPEEDRFYLKENVTAPEVIHRWTHEIDFERVLPLVAVNQSGEIIADATLHRSRSPARRHMGELRIVVDPAYREQGLGTRLIRELLDVATDLGLERAIFELVAHREEAAIEAAIRTGFSRVASLKGWVKDIYGNPQELVLLELLLTERRPWWWY